MPIKKNYLEHEIKVKIIDRFLSHVNDWRWLIDYIKDNFDLNDISSWFEFRNSYSVLKDIFNFFIKILESCDFNENTENEVLDDIINVAKYFVGLTKSLDFTITHTNFGKVLLFMVQIAKIENAVNGTSKVVDFELLTQKNYWRIVGIEAINKIKEELDTCPKINIDGWERVSKTLDENLNLVSFSYSKDFFNQYKDNLYNANAFSNQHIIIDDNYTWEERNILEMLFTSVKDKGLQSAIEFRNGHGYPDKSKWTLENLQHIDEFFDNEYASFIIKTVEFLLHGGSISNSIILAHFNLLYDYCNEKEEMDVVTSSSFKIISLFFSNKQINDEVRSDASFIGTISKLHEFKEPNIIITMQNEGFPISKEQRSILKREEENYYCSAESLNTINDFMIFLERRGSTFYLTDEQLEVINDKFVTLVDGQDDLLVTNLFYEYMVFLLDVNSYSKDINKKTIHNYMINTQLLWELEHYDKQCEKMHRFSHEVPVKGEDIKAFNYNAVKNPLSIAAAVKQATTSELCEQMVNISEHAISHLFSRMKIGSAFPIKEVHINYDRHEIEKLLLDHIKWIKKEYGYKFLNILEDEKYLFGLLENYRMKVEIIIGLINDEKLLFEEVKKCSDDSLIDFDDKEFSLAHVTQLFPLLERKIRELASNTGYFPFKKNLDEFMQYNDPSSLLREMILDSCEGIHGFDPIPDLLFIYNCMYNSNSLNIRNECIHGRGYTSKGGLHFALKTTLICILMVEERLQIIFHNRRVSLKNNSGGEVHEQ